MIDIASLEAWIGRTETVEDTVAPFQAAALAATLDRDDAPGPGEPLPPLWHWIYFLNLHKSSELAENGHGRQGDFIPPMPLPRRMFAGARMTFPRALKVGARARRTSTINDVKLKQGSSGELIFLRVRNEIAGADGPAVIEEQDIVYRAPPLPGAAAPPPRHTAAQAVWTREVETNEMVLFRYSALIFNAHRIHWDRPYAEGKEGYAGLVVHGQLIATLLADLVRTNTDQPVSGFRFRSVRALIDHARCRLCGVPDGNSVRLWAEDQHGALVMEAQADLS